MVLIDVNNAQHTAERVQDLAKNRRVIDFAKAEDDIKYKAKSYLGIPDSSFEKGLRYLLIRPQYEGVWTTLEGQSSPFGISVLSIDKDLFKGLKLDSEGIGIVVGSRKQDLDADLFMMHFKTRYLTPFDFGYEDFFKYEIESRLSGVSSGKYHMYAARREIIGGVFSLQRNDSVEDFVKKAFWESLYNKNIEYAMRHKL
jgi:hypothetical protein